MNVAQAVEALDQAAERVVSFGLRHNFRHDGRFFVYAHELDQRAVDAAQADERRTNPGVPLVASAGMKAGTHVALIEAKDMKDFRDRTVWMSTHEAEKHTQAEFVAQARGRVLIAGLGLGMVVDAVLAKPEVRQVVVVEKNTEVTRLMSPLLDGLEARHRDKRFRIAYADIFDWKARGRFDAIYFDIWPNFSAPNLSGMMKLRRQFRDRLVAGGWMGCWGEKECRDILANQSKKMGGKFKEVLRALDELYSQCDVQHMCKIDEGADYDDQE